MKNLFRKPKRTLFLILGMALANALTIWILTFRESSFHSMMDNVLGMRFGQEQIAHKDYYDFEKGKINQFKTIDMTNFDHISEEATFRVQSTTLMASENNAVPMVVSGYDISEELAKSKLSGIIDKNFKFTNQFPLILGKRLSQALEAKEGSEIGIIGQAIDGSVANEIFIVEKIIDIGGGEFERNFAVTSLEGMQEFLNMQRNRAHLFINFGKVIQEKKISKDLKKIRWQNLLPEIASSSGFMQRFTRFFAFFFAVIASLAMINTLSLSFLERIKEYRMSTIIGAPMQWLKKSMSLEIICISLISIILGNIIVLFFIGVFYFFPINLSILTGGEPLQMGGMIMSQDVKIVPELWIFVISNTFFILTQIIASIYPVKVILKKGQRI